MLGNDAAENGTKARPRKCVATDSSIINSSCWCETKEESSKRLFDYFSVKFSYLHFVETFNFKRLPLNFIFELFAITKIFVTHIRIHRLFRLDTGISVFSRYAGNTGISS